MALLRDPQSQFRFLSELLLSSSTHESITTDPAIDAIPARIIDTAQTLTTEGLEELKTLAMTNHVIIRAFEVFEPILRSQGAVEAAELAASALRNERLRIDHALGFLERICGALEGNGCKATVIKSLDHWPDLGSDLDLYTGADPARVVQVMATEFGAKLAERSWGDRLANKWNFIVPGLPEMIEVHIGRLGQTGEQTDFTESLMSRTRIIEIGQHTFRVLAPEDRVVISTMQRMYRHFYIRLCDILDNACLLDARQVNFDDLHAVGTATGLWEGIATYLVIISQYVESYRGYGVPLPSLVSRSAKFGVGPVRFRRDFLRVPILPHSLNLYAGELKTLILQGQLRNSLRLSLLPGLATAAALEMKVTGSDKGIW
jgi:Uncharacterised nucleotidyltransferase